MSVQIKYSVLQSTSTTCYSPVLPCTSPDLSPLQQVSIKISLTSMLIYTEFYVTFLVQMRSLPSLSLHNTLLFGHIFFYFYLIFTPSLLKIPSRTDEFFFTCVHHTTENNVYIKWRTTLMSVLIGQCSQE